MSTYLTTVGSIYYFRRVVPDGLKYFFRTATGQPRHEFKLSLRTKDRREAERRGRIKAVEYDRLFADAVEQLASTSPRNGTDAISAGDVANMELAYQADLEEEIAWDQREADRRAIIKAAMAPTAGPDMLAIRDLIDESFLRTPEQQAARESALAAEWEEGARHFVSGSAGRTLAGMSPTYPHLMDLFDGYLDERKPEPATIKRWRPVIAHLIEFLGHDDASLLTTVDVVRWKQHLLAETHKGVLARGARTVRETYIAALKVVLAWGRENGQLEASVAEKVSVRVPKAKKLREKEFTADEATTILRATLRPLNEQLTPEHALARRWVPWLCAYTGARVNEITQLRAKDVHQVGDVWCITITPEAGSQKKGEARTVPLHEHLVTKGFPAVAQAVGEGPIFYDPRRARGGSHANPQYKKVAERIGQWVKGLGLAGVQPNHAWRHLWVTVAREAGVDTQAQDAFLGHAPGSEGRKYGSKTVPYLVRELAKFPRFVV